MKYTITITATFQRSIEVEAADEDAAYAAAHDQFDSTHLGKALQDAEVIDLDFECSPH